MLPGCSGSPSFLLWVVERQDFRGSPRARLRAAPQLDCRRGRCCPEIPPMTCLQGRVLQGSWAPRELGP